MDKSYNQTLYACFTGYIVQAIVNNFVPLLFLTFHNSYGIPMTQITLLITFNFGLQLLVDMLSVTFVDRIGYRASMIIAHVCAAAGFLFLTILPDLLECFYGADDCGCRICGGRRTVRGIGKSNRGSLSYKK